MELVACPSRKRKRDQCDLIKVDPKMVQHTLVMLNSLQVPSHVKYRQKRSSTITHDQDSRDSRVVRVSNETGRLRSIYIRKLLRKCQRELHAQLFF